jgi:hypothetical protein
MEEDYPRTLQELERRFSTEKACREYRIRPAKYTVDGVWGGRIGYFALLAA